MGVQRERKEQEILVAWFKLKYPDILIVASANGGARNIREAANMKREGVLAGFPDLQIFAARHGYHGLLVEYKTEKGKATALQRIVRDKLLEHGYCAGIMYGLEQAKHFIDWYLDEKS